MEGLKAVHRHLEAACRRRSVVAPGSITQYTFLNILIKESMIQVYMHSDRLRNKLFSFNHISITTLLSGQEVSYWIGGPSYMSNNNRDMKRRSLKPNIVGTSF